MEDLLSTIAKTFSHDLVGGIILVLIIFSGLSVARFAYRVVSDRNANLSKVLQELIKTVASNTNAIQNLENELHRMDAIFKKIPAIEQNLAIHEVRIENLEKDKEKEK